MWLRPDGEEMAETDWFDDHRRTLGMWINGSGCLSRSRDGELVSDDSWLLVLHAGDAEITVTLPAAEYGKRYVPVLDTTRTDGEPADATALAPGDDLVLPGRSLLLLRALR